MNIQILGEVRAWDDDKNPVDLGPPKCRVVLAALALSVGSAVPVNRLVNLVWGEDGPRTAEKTLQSYVTRLRKGLGPDSIVRVGAAYRLDVAPDSVDASRFDSKRAVGDVSGALGEWGGPPLAGLEVGGLDAVIDGLVESWLGLVELDAAKQVAGGETARALGELTSLTSSHPYREGLWALLMIALYLDGRQADALAAFGRCRRGLIDGLGVEPGTRLRELEAAILAQDDAAVRASLPDRVTAVTGGQPEPGPSVDRSDGEPGSGGIMPSPAEPVASGQGETPQGGSGSPPVGTVTFGFCDVVDSARLWATDGPGMAATSIALEDLVRAAATSNGGHVFSVVGDSVGVAFHRATDGLHWATALRAAAADLAPAAGAQLEVRIGLHTGETEAHDGGYLGPAVVLASRLATIGHGGQILVSGACGELLGDEPLTDLGMFRLEGAVVDQRVLQVGDDRNPPLQSEGNRRGNLSRRSNRLFGRDDGLGLVTEALSESPLVTLVGPGGIGKTSLAMATAQLVEADYPGGVWVVALAGVPSSDEVVRAVADTLNIDDVSARAPLDGLVSVLQNRKLLLVLDNCEHVVDGAAELADAITAACVDVRILATSREGLGVQNERLFPVAPLDVDGAAVELFNKRAAAVSADFLAEDHEPEVREICARLDGVPLAIELAAARTTTLTPGDLVERIGDRLRLLTGGRRTTMERHRTLRATIQWSYDLLSPAEQRLFQQLSVFAGPFDLTAVVAVALIDGDADGQAVSDLDVLPVDGLLSGLVDQSMVIAEPGTFGRRFRLLEAMRDFGAEYLDRAGDPDLVARGHADWCAKQVSAIRSQLGGQDELEGVTRLNELWPNLRAAFTWALTVEDAALAHRLLEPIASEIYVRNRNEIGLLALRLLDIAPVDDRDLVTFGVIWAARRYMRNEDPDGFERLVAENGHPEDPRIEYARAFVHGDLAERVRVAPIVVEMLRDNGDGYGADLFEVVGHGLSLLMVGDVEAVDRLLTPLAERFAVDGPPTCLNWSLIYLGMAAEVQGRVEDAQRLYDASAAVDLPPKTQTWNRALDARAAFRRGSRAEAYETLGQYADDLLEAEDIHGARRIYGEFIEMMVRAEEVAKAWEVLAFLRRSGLPTTGYGPRFGTVVEAVDRFEADNPQPGVLLAEGDDRAVLAYIRTTLDRLATSESAAP